MTRQIFPVGIVKTKRTFIANANGWTIPATPTDMVTLQGADGITMRLLRVIIEGTQTTAGINKYFLIKRSAVDTTGTFVADTIVPVDSNNIGSKATFGHYTANPGGLGATVGNLAVPFILNPAPASLADMDHREISFEFMTGEEVILRASTENIALNFNGAALPTGLTLSVTFIWTEE